MKSDSRAVAVALILKVTEHARRLERKEKLLPAEKRRLLRIRTAKAVLGNVKEK